MTQCFMLVENIDIKIDKARINRIVVHFHRNPSTGVWSIMKHLVTEQNRDPSVLSILGIPTPEGWRDAIKTACDDHFNCGHRCDNESKKPFSVRTMADVADDMLYLYRSDLK